jgi:hypothetical protein
MLRSPGSFQTSSVCWRLATRPGLGLGPRPASHRRAGESWRRHRRRRRAVDFLVRPLERVSRPDLLRWPTGKAANTVMSLAAALRHLLYVARRRRGWYTVVSSSSATCTRPGCSKIVLDRHGDHLSRFLDRLASIVRGKCPWHRSVAPMRRPLPGTRRPRLPAHPRLGRCRCPRRAPGPSPRSCGIEVPPGGRP